MNYLTTKELCERLKITRQSVYDWRKQGMPYKKFGKLVRFEYDEVKAWLEKR